MTNFRAKIAARTKTAANFECYSSGPYENKTQKRFSKFCFENHAVIMIESSDKYLYNLWVMTFFRIIYGSKPVFMINYKMVQSLFTRFAICGRLRT